LAALRMSAALADDGVGMEARKGGDALGGSVHDSPTPKGTPLALQISTKDSPFVFLT
jgi:hypothetical protein